MHHRASRSKAVEQKQRAVSPPHGNCLAVKNAPGSSHAKVFTRRGLEKNPTLDVKLALEDRPDSRYGVHRPGLSENEAGLVARLLGRVRSFVATEGLIVKVKGNAQDFPPAVPPSRQVVLFVCVRVWLTCAACNQTQTNSMGVQDQKQADPLDQAVGAVAASCRYRTIPLVKPG